METLRRGSRGMKVEFLQRLLNKALRRDRAAGTALNEDGVFGPLTESAVRAFQGRHRPLAVDGAVGALSWTALGFRTEAEHRSVIQFGQPTNTSCWSAAATEILGNQSVGPGGASVGPGGGLGNSPQNREVFAQSLGWRALNYSPTVPDFVGLIQHSPLWMCGGGSNWSHAIALSGVWSDLDPSGDGTMVRIHDPWPVNVGKIYSSFCHPIQMYNSTGSAKVPSSLEGIIVPR
ncbi:MAG: peptidoglycan-binding protein [Bryobacterales bacterium]|nr:peptidoglycan-binding protein [Bryobacterales bacterium]